MGSVLRIPLYTYYDNNAVNKASSVSIIMDDAFISRIKAWRNGGNHFEWTGEDITDIPDDNPSSPSIRFIAFVTPTIHKIVIIVENTSPICGAFINGNAISSILTPNTTTIVAAII